MGRDKLKGVPQPHFNYVIPQTQHNKAYPDPVEDALRKSLFIANLAMIETHNEKYKKGEVSYELGINQFSDRKAEELSKMHGKRFPKPY